MTRTLRTQQIGGLPTLAWAARISAADSVVEVIHGDGVLCAETWVAEGAWPGPCAADGFAETPVLLGSGLLLTPTGVRVRGTTHILERLWAVRASSHLIVSNSLPLALAWEGYRLPISNPHVEADLLSFIDGPARMRPVVARDAYCTVSQFECADFVVGNDLALQHQQPPVAPRFADFSAYHDHVMQLCSAVVKNANDASRPQRFRPLATVSRGYDSPACAVFARACGATEAVTFGEAREGYATATDDGTDIAHVLGLRPQLFSRDAYLRGDGAAELASLASGGGGEDVVLAAAGALLRQSVVFTGFLGDTLWGLAGNPDASERLAIRYPGGGSMGEYRLQCGFVHLPIPILTLASHGSVLAISHSPEMTPWRLGSEYDRPIPRRIAESAGIPRDAFGSNKMAITAPMYYDRAPSDVLSPAALERFERFAHRWQHEIAESLTAYGSSYARRRVLHAVQERVEWRTSAWVKQIPWLSVFETRLSARCRRAPSPTLFLVHWAVSELADQYRDALGASGVKSAMPGSA